MSLKMSLKTDLETNFAECVLNAGKVILGEKQRREMDPDLQKEQNRSISHAICALLNSGGGVIKIEIANEDYDYRIHGVGLELPPMFRGYLDELQQEDQNLFFIFVKSWNAKASGVRLATLSSNLYQRHKTSTNKMTSEEALAFLREKTQTFRNTFSLSPKNIQDGVQSEEDIKASAAALFDRNHLQYLETLNFTQSTHVEFKMFSEEELQHFEKDLSRCVSAFANTEGGYIFWGVHKETRQVIGCEEEKIDPTTMRDSIGSWIRKLPVHHFCTQRCEIKYAIKFFEVKNQGALRGYVCAVKVEQFCCAVFAEEPSAWQVKDNWVIQLAPKEWATWMIETDPDLSRNSDMVLQLSVSSATPKSRSVCTHKNLEFLREQQKRYFPVSSENVEYVPQKLYTELFLENGGLKRLINKEMHGVSQGLLIFSRSWAVDVGLQEKQEVICDVLLLSQEKIPVLYTILRKDDGCWEDYTMRVARTLKQKLVNTGGYTGKFCLLPKAFLLNPDTTAKALNGSKLPSYPVSYCRMTTEDMEVLLQSLLIVLGGFRSLLSEELGCEVLNLLTDKQYELLSMNLRKTRLLFVHGLPGSGKTILAFRIMEKIRNVFHCQPGGILYICENQPLKDFVSRKNICQAVTRKAFMITNSNFENIQHIVIDEAQNFRTEDGDWYEKAKAITRRGKGGPGILWVFLDYFQTSHTEHSGLPDLQHQYPREELSRVVRNADPIANYLQEIMQKVREYPPPNISSESLNIFREAEWSRGVPGHLEISEHKDMEQLVDYIAEKCHSLVKAGYSCQDIAVICSIASDVHKYTGKLRRALRKRKRSQSNEESDLLVVESASAIMGKHIVLDSVRRFSGLERNIVFGINPITAQPAVFHNLLLSLASRAKKQLYILKFSN